MLCIEYNIWSEILPANLFCMAEVIKIKEQYFAYYCDED